MIEYEREYFQWVTNHVIRKNGRVICAPTAYLAYLKAVSRRLNLLISPVNLSNLNDVEQIDLQLRSQSIMTHTISNYKTAMNHYIEMVRTNELKPTLKFQLSPIEQFRIKDLVQSAGGDVSDWKNYTDPRYCFEWSFTGPENIIIFCMWYELIQERNNLVFQELNLRETAQLKINGSQRKRALKMDSAIKKAYENHLPLRVVICAGRGDDENISSRAKKRLLDMEPWRVEAYNNETGATTLARGYNSNVQDIQIVDDTFDDLNHIDYSQLGTDGGTVSISIKSYIKRDRQVRLAVINRAQGKCENVDCGTFRGYNGFLDVHHILGVATSDRYCNCVALCPNCHREAHVSPCKDAFNNRLLHYAAKYID